MLDNVPNLQSSWVTMGHKVGQVALRFGANDYGSLMMEENVVSAAGTTYRTTLEEIDRLHPRRRLPAVRRRRQDYTRHRGVRPRGRMTARRHRLRLPPLRRGPPADAGRRHAFRTRSGLAGHSDADAVAHALTDAILGAAGAGNIGQLFPDSDPQWKDADSMELLRTAHELVRGRGLRAGAGGSAPSSPSARARRRTSTRWPPRSPRGSGVAAGAVSVKAKTNEGMGFIGRGEGLAVIAVAMLEAR